MNELVPGPETEAFLRKQLHLVLGTIRRDGSPQASPVWFLWTGRAFLVSTIEATAKWHNLTRDRRCSACIDNPETGQMVVAYGQANLRREDVKGETRALVEKYYPGEPAASSAHMQRIFAPDAPRPLVIEMEPDRLITRTLDV